MTRRRTTDQCDDIDPRNCIDNAQQALEAYAAQSGNACMVETCIDLLTDLAHWMHNEDLAFDVLAALALDHAVVELPEIALACKTRKRTGQGP